MPCYDDIELSLFVAWFFLVYFDRKWDVIPIINIYSSIIDEKGVLTDNRDTIFIFFTLETGFAMKRVMAWNILALLIYKAWYLSKMVAQNMLRKYEVK